MKSYVELVKMFNEVQEKAKDEVIEMTREVVEVIGVVIGLASRVGSYISDEKDFLENHFESNINDKEDFIYYLGKYSRELENEKSRIDGMIDLLER